LGISIIKTPDSGRPLLPKTFGVSHIWEIRVFEAYDDWFLLVLIFFGDIRYYRCDQLDGIIMCLRDHYVIPR